MTRLLSACFNGHVNVRCWERSILEFAGMSWITGIQMLLRGVTTGLCGRPLGPAYIGGDIGGLATASCDEGCTSFSWWIVEPILRLKFCSRVEWGRVWFKSFSVVVGEG
jgi:hypothetical protein